MKTFYQNIAVDTSKSVEEIQGASYLSWVVALALAGRPHQDVVVNAATGLAVHEVFGGGYVAIDMPVGDRVQRTWLPVLDNRNNAVPYERITSREVNDSLQRCRAKAVAMVTGLGMSLYAGHAGNAAAFVKRLGLTPESDLGREPAAVSQKKDDKTGRVLATYLDWAVALAAARITDGSFHWEVGTYVDPKTGEKAVPYMTINSTYMVSVNITYRGVNRTEYLPIMGVLPVQTRNGVKPMDYQPLTAPDVFDWNRAVMRCLAKTIAVATGYGLSLYADEDLTRFTREEGAAPTLPVAAKRAEEPKREAPASAVDNKPASKEEIASVRALLKAAKKDEQAVCTWLGIQALESASANDANRAAEVLRKAAKKDARKAA